jgi:hypothetical protein
MKNIFTIILLTVAFSGYAQKYTPAQIDSIVRLAAAAEEILPAFIDSNSILVVFKETKKDINKYLEKQLEKQYKGEYRLLEQGESLNKSDTSRTRFFVSIINKFVSGYGSGNSRVSPETLYQMMMIDRKTGKTYTFKEATSCYSCLFETYFKKLEKLRTKTK